MTSKMVRLGGRVFNGWRCNAATTSAAGKALIDNFSSKIDFCWKEEIFLCRKELFNRKSRRINLRQQSTKKTAMMMSIVSLSTTVSLCADEDCNRKPLFM
jgi:hypothetical protein